MIRGIIHKDVDYLEVTWKYQTLRNLELYSPFMAHNIVHKFFNISPAGIITAKEGYAWDGSSGPTIDSKYCMRASLFHDILYQCFREQLFFPNRTWNQEEHNRLRYRADKLYRDILRADGKSAFVSWLRYRALRLLGGKHAAPTAMKD